jgi:phosphatidate cytidylyltransferase
MSEHASRVPGASPMQATPSTGSASGSWLADLVKRLATAGILIPIAVALIFFGGWVAFGGAVLTLVISLLELRAMLAKKGWYPALLVSGLAGLGFLIAAELPAERVAIFALSLSALLVGAFTWAMLLRPTIEQTLVDLALTLAIPLYIAWPMTLFLLLRGPRSGVSTHNFWWVLALFVIVWANDTAAFVTGHFIGKHRLASHISPAKTWEGFAGGLGLAIVASYVLTLPLHIPWYHAVLLGILVTFAATIGDLAESLLKRVCGVKDSGTIVPGHGGILDRIDSLLFAVVVAFFYAAFLQGIVRL